MGNPVVTLTQARSGSSLLMKILKNHGMEVSGYLETNRHGYCDYENRELVNYSRTYWPLDAQNVNYPKPKVDFRAFIHGLMPDDERRYAFKGFIPLWRVWLCELPEADYIFSTRNLDEIVSSARQKLKSGGRNPRAEDERFIGGWRDEIFRVAKLLRRPVVNMSAVVEGDYEMLSLAMLLCGVEMDEQRVEAAIDPGKWRQWRDER